MLCARAALAVLAAASAALSVGGFAGAAEAAPPLSQPAPQPAASVAVEAGRLPRGPELSEHRRLADRRAVVIGERAYSTWTADGLYPAMGFHTRGEMGGIWSPPIKLLDGLWFALEDATLENGCLWALPGGHKGPLRERWRRNVAGALVMERLDDTPWPEEGVPLEAPKGTLVVLHGKLPHGSAPNRSAQSRHAYTLHLIDGACAYPVDNWLQRGRDLPLRGFEL